MEPDHSGFFHGFKEHGANSVAGVPRLRANSAANPTDPKPRTERETSGNQRSAHQDSIARSKPPVQTSLQLQDAVDWLDVGLCKALIRGVCELGYVAPTPVQVKMIPAVMQGYDVCARAVTGSGKTAAFLLPLLHRLMTDATRITGGASSHVGTTGTTMGIKALILTPTRELALQCQESFEALSRFARNPPICSCTVGGVPMAAHVAELRRFPDAVVATPGRILDLLRNAPGITLETLHTFVLDEADKMLSCGYEEMVHQVLREVPKKRQSLLVSATMTRDVDKLARLALTRPLDIDIGPAAVSAQLHQEFIRVPEDGKRLKLAMIHHLCTEVYQNSKTLIFAKHLTTVRRIKIILQLLGLKVLTLHGELSMPERIAAVEQFSSGKASDEDLTDVNGSTNEPYQIMVATELAARGLDIPCIETVINYDMATTLTNYIHRVGRTARIGRCGRAVSLVLPIDEDIMSKVVRLTESPFGGVISKVLCRELDPEAVLRSQERVDAVFEDAREELLGDVMERNIRATESRVKRLDESSEGTLRPSRGTSSAGSGPTWFETRQEKNHRAQEAKKAFKRAREDGTIEVGAADNESEEPPELERFTAGDLFTRKRKKGAHSKTPSQQWLEEKERKVKERKKGAFWEDTTGVLGGRKIPKRVSSPLDLKGHLPKGSFRRVRKTEERRQWRASSATTEKGKQQKGKRSAKHAGSQAKPLRAGGGKSAGKKPSRSRQRNRR